MDPQAEALKYAARTAGINAGSQFSYGGQQYTFNGPGSVSLVPQPKTSPVSVQPTNTTTSSALGQTTTTFDIQNLLNENQKMMKDYLAQYQASLMPSQAELDLQNQLATQRQNMTNAYTAAQNAGNNEFNSVATFGGPLELATGRKAELLRQQQINLDNMGQQEKNLIAQLEMAQGNRKLSAEAQKAAIDTYQILNNQNLQYAQFASQQQERANAPQQAIQQQIIKDSLDYPDAGILPTDDLATALAKKTKSQKWKLEQARLADLASSDGKTTTNSGIISLYTPILSQLISTPDETGKIMTPEEAVISIQTIAREGGITLKNDDITQLLSIAKAEKQRIEQAKNAPVKRDFSESTFSQTPTTPKDQFINSISDFLYSSNSTQPFAKP